MKLVAVRTTRNDYRTRDDIWHVPLMHAIMVDEIHYNDTDSFVYNASKGITLIYKDEKGMIIGKTFIANHHILEYIWIKYG